MAIKNDDNHPHIEGVDLHNNGVPGLGNHPVLPGQDFSLRVGRWWRRICHKCLSHFLPFQFKKNQHTSHSYWHCPHSYNSYIVTMVSQNKVWTISNALWFGIGSFLGQGCDILPKYPHHTSKTFKHSFTIYQHKYSVLEDEPLEWTIGKFQCFWF